MDTVCCTVCAHGAEKLELMRVLGYNEYGKMAACLPPLPGGGEMRVKNSETMRV